MVQDNPKIAVEYLSEIAVVTLTDEKILEEADIQALENSITPLIEQAPGMKMILDFSNVQFLSSAVLGLLIRKIISSINPYNTGIIRHCFVLRARCPQNLSAGSRQYIIHL